MYSIINITSENLDGTINGIWLQDAIGDISYAFNIAKQTKAANDNKIDIAIVPKASGGNVGSLLHNQKCVVKINKHQNQPDVSSVDIEATITVTTNHFDQNNSASFGKIRIIHPDTYEKVDIQLTPKQMKQLSNEGLI